VGDEGSDASERQSAAGVGGGMGMGMSLVSSSQCLVGKSSAEVMAAGWSAII